MELMAEEVDFVSITMSDYGGRYLKAQNLGELRQEHETCMGFIERSCL